MHNLASFDPLDTKPTFPWLLWLNQLYEWLFERASTDNSLQIDPLRRNMYDVINAIFAVSVVTFVIAIIDHFILISNISLLYLIAIIYLAITKSRTAANLAAILAFFAYDFFFVPPIYTFTVNNPTEWFSLGALTVTALVVGQLAAEVRLRERLAVASEQRIAILYQQAEAIAGTPEMRALLPLIVRRVVTVFAPSGVDAASLWLPDTSGTLVLRAIDHHESHVPHPLDTPQHQIQAEAARQSRTITAAIEPEPDHVHLTYYVPLISGQQVVGVLGLMGNERLAALLALPPTTPVRPSLARYAKVARAVQASLFAAFREQIALALEREVLRQDAIHVGVLRETDRIKNEFFGSVTHDLRTPIAAIMASASTLLENDVNWTDEERHEFLESINNGAVRLSRMVNNLLLISKMEAGSDTPQLAPYPINDVVANVLDELERGGIIAQREVTVAIAEDPLEALMDPVQIARVMQNLIENAAKYSPPGTGITIAARRAADVIIVEVSDHGVGIPPNKYQAIFESFTRLQQPLPWKDLLPAAGTGLGLHISKRIIEAHGGKIWVKSQVNHGSTFAFSLPLANAARPSARPILIEEVLQ